MHRKNILIYVQQDATLHSLFYLETALHVLGGTTTHHQEHIWLCLQHLVFVALLQTSKTVMLEAANKEVLLLNIDAYSYACILHFLNCVRLGIC
jgi:hypothetical protein